MINPRWRKYTGFADSITSSKFQWLIGYPDISDVVPIAGQSSMLSMLSEVTENNKSNMFAFNRKYINVYVTFRPTYISA